MAMDKVYAPLNAEEQRVGQTIRECAFKVHKALGPGLLESVYEVCLCHELSQCGLQPNRQVSVPIFYDGIRFDEGLRLDILVNNAVICELKAVEQLLPVHEAQILTQLKLTGKRLGYLINFNVPLIKDGIKRFII